MNFGNGLIDSHIGRSKRMYRERILALETAKIKAMDKAQLEEALLASFKTDLQNIWDEDTLFNMYAKRTSREKANEVCGDVWEEMGYNRNGKPRSEN